MDQNIGTMITQNPAFAAVDYCDYLYYHHAAEKA